MKESSVDLPEPLAPISVSVSPAAISSEKGAIRTLPAKAMLTSASLSAIGASPAGRPARKASSGGTASASAKAAVRCLLPPDESVTASIGSCCSGPRQ